MSCGSCLQRLWEEAGNEEEKKIDLHLLKELPPFMLLKTIKSDPENVTGGKSPSTEPSVDCTICSVM
jgi:hypothetical protein